MFSRDLARVNRNLRRCLPLCLNLDSLDLRINLIGGKDVEKSGKSFNQANQGADDVELGGANLANIIAQGYLSLRLAFRYVQYVKFSESF